MKSYVQPLWVKFAQCLLSTTFFMLFFPLLVSGQIRAASDGYTPSGIEPGGQGDFENVNLATGRLNVSIPLLSIGGRGQAGYTMTLPIERQWNVSNTWAGETVIPRPLYFVDSQAWSAGAGLGAGAMVMRWGIQKSGFSCNSTNGYGYTLTRYTFIRPDGGEIQFVDAATNGASNPWPKQGAGGQCTGSYSRGNVWYSIDGSGMTFVADQVFNEQSLSPFPLNYAGNLMMKDGIPSANGREIKSP